MAQRMTGYAGIVIALAGLSLAACSSAKVDTVSDFRGDTRITLQSLPFEKTIPTASINDWTIWDIAEEYSHVGDGMLALTVTYDKASSSNTAKKAADEASRIAAGLRKLGVQKVSTSILPVNGQGDVSGTVISYAATKALPPDGCEHMGGIYDKPTDTDKNLRSYEYGCSTNMLLARQVVRPRDLAGTAGYGHTEFDGRRGYYTLGNYRTGVANVPLEGYSATQAINQ